MKKYQKELIKLTAIEALKMLGDFVAEFHSGSSMYRKEMNKYLRRRRIDRQNFYDRLYYLAHEGYIEGAFEERQKIYQLTKKGKEKLKEFNPNDFEIHPKIPEHWDGRWRIVIWDVPEVLKVQRNIFRRRIKDYGFVKVQKSVYIFPFECEQDIIFLATRLGIVRYISMFKAFVLMGEPIFARKFVKMGILKKEYFKDFDKYSR